MVTRGKDIPYGLPVLGSRVAGPVVTTRGFLVLRLHRVSELMTKYLSVSIALPGPIILSQYPWTWSSAEYFPAACESPEK